MTCVYPPVYQPAYCALPFPANPLDLQVDLLIGSSAYTAVYTAAYGATWTPVTSYVYQRDGTSPPVRITRGRPDETATANPSQMVLVLNNRDGRFSSRNPSGPWYGQLNRNTGIRASVPADRTFLRLADDASSGCTSTDSAALQALGSPDISIDMRLDSHVPCLLMSKWSAGGQGWALALDGDGSLTFYWTTGGVASQATTAGLGLAVPLGRVMVRVLLDATTGNLWAWTAPSMGGTQTLLAMVPGGGPTTVDGAPGFGVTIGYNPWFPASYGLQGPLGRVYEAQVWSAAGTMDTALLADPLFTSQAPGTASFADVHGNTWAMGGTAEVSGRSYRFHGEMSSLPGGWDPTGRDVYVLLTAGGILRRLQQGNAPALSACRRFVSSLTGTLAPVAYWPCEDGTGATQFGSGAPGGFPMVISGNPALAADSTSFLCSGALPQVNGSQWSGLVANYRETGTVVVRFMFTPGSSISGNAAVLRIDTTGAGPVYVVYVPGTGYVLQGGVVASSLVNAAGPVMVSAELTTSGGTIATNLRLLNPAGVITSAGLILNAGTVGIVTKCTVNPFPDNAAVYGSAANSTVGQITVQSDLQPLSQLVPLITAYSGETAGNRFARLCAQYGIPCRIYGYPATSAQMGPQTSGTLVSLLQECETADRGLIYEPAEGLGLGYRTAASMLSQSPSVTLDYAQAHLGLAGQPGEFTPTDDDQFTRNDVLFTQGSPGGPSGTTVQLQLDDGSPMSISPPPAGVGDYQTGGAATVNVLTPAALADAAGWALHLGTVNESRYPSVPLNLARSELTALRYAIQDVRIGDLIQVNNPPLPQVAPGAIVQAVLGVTEQLGGFWYQVVWNSVPGSPYQTAVSDDLVYGRADTDGSQLASGIGTGDTSFGVATTGPSGIIWTTAAADFPFEIVVGGEVMLVSLITGSASPQTFTVTRSVNGVSASHAAGSDLRLYPTPVLALA